MVDKAPPVTAKSRKAHKKGVVEATEVSKDASESIVHSTSLSSVLKIAHTDKASNPIRQCDAEALDAGLLEMVFGEVRANSYGGAPQVVAWELATEKFSVAKKLKARGEEEAALAAALDAALLNVQDERVWILLARYALDMKIYSLADAASRRAVTLEPHSAIAAGLRAEALFALGRLEAAESYLLASIFHGAKDADGASEAIFRCHNQLNGISGGGVSLPFSEIADAAISVGKRREAIAAFTKGAAWARTPDLSRTLLSLCDIEEGSGAREVSNERPNAPLVLISQIQRSGGSLIAQLFDGHPEVFAHPHELHIGRPEKWNWPKLDLSNEPLDILNDLFETVFLKFIVRGYSKGDGNKAAADDLRRFTFSIETMVTEFKALAKDALLQRDLIDAYLFAFFKAWGEYAVTGKERYITAFCPRLSSYPESADGFFADYPDGRMICCVRDPVSWYASSSRHDKEYSDLDRALGLWRTSTEKALMLVKARPDAVHLLTYNDLVDDTRIVMNRIADWLGIKRLPLLTAPTFAGQAVMPNSSYAVKQFGVQRKSKKDAPVLPEAMIGQLTQSASGLYDEAVSAIKRQNDAFADNTSPASA